MTTIPASAPRSGPAAALLLTRPAAASEAFAQMLGPWAGEIIVSPVLDITCLSHPPPEPAPKALIFTSKNAVACYAGPPDLPCYCIGAATTAAAEARGFRAHRVGSDAAELVKKLAKWEPPTPLVHVRGVHVAQPVAADLTAQGLQCGEWIVYDQEARPLTAAAGAALDAASGDSPTPLILPVFSPRSAELLCEMVHAREGTPVGCFVAISVAVAQRIAKLLPNAVIFTAERPDARAMVAAVHASARHVHMLEGKSPLP